MALTWWPVAIAGFACAAAAIVLALVLPMEQVRRQLRRMANTSRLTRLPEYARLARARLFSMLIAVALIAVLLGTAVVASARPNGWWWSSAVPDPPEDIMLCVGEPADEPVTGEFLTYFANEARTYGTERIGLTSANRRVIPMTRDYQYVAGRLGDLSRLSRDRGDDGGVSPASFSPEVSYVDYASSVEDVLALCMTGFPTFESTSSHRRSLIYLGSGQLRAPEETRPSLLTAEQVSAMASKAGIQINALSTSSRNAGVLPTIAKSSGGQYFSLENRQDQLTGDLDAIRSNPPAATEPIEETATSWFGDAPAVPLAVAVVASMLLCLSLMVLRR
ncbi:hypothetical protein [Mycolicibacterium sp. 120270]|uniref:hypothetical protein n=1 Tax=Mycolicibacterium sp. 120270 TaxID=3090600 RepID=UPI00299DA32A|nr:hypothetical protein [Mycolicibacterium sp. 120270]MDX1883425.1 hypothetical protein [Mycolicibacterium sp. 120270]